MVTNNATNTGNPVTVAQGGTGLATLTAHSVQVGNGTGTVTQLAVGADHSICMGVTGADPTFTTSGTPYVTGISFNSGTNTLSSYVSSSFTPAITFGGGNTGITYANQIGQYIQIGNMIFVSLRVTLTNKGSSTGVALLTGLPVTVSQTTESNILFTSRTAITTDAGFTYLAALSVNSSTTAGLYEVGSNKAITQLSDTNFANTSDFTITGAYQA